MKSVLFLFSLVSLSSCITYHEAQQVAPVQNVDFVKETKEKEPKVQIRTIVKEVPAKAKEVVKVVEKTKTVKVNTGCKPMTMPNLRPVPALPKREIEAAKSKGHLEMDSVLLKHISQLREVISANNAAVRRAVANQNASCSK